MKGWDVNVGRCNLNKFYNFVGWYKIRNFDIFDLFTGFAYKETYLWGIPEKLDSGHMVWTLELWMPGCLASKCCDSGQLDAWTLDAWTLDSWTQKILLILSDIYSSLIIIYCRIFKHFNRSMTNVLWLYWNCYE